MTQPQLYTIIALCVYAIAMALIGCFSFGKSKTLDGFLIGGRNILVFICTFVGINAVVEMLAATAVVGAVCGALEKTKLIGGK